MSKKITEHSTQAGKVLFMSAARPWKNEKTGKAEFSVKVVLNSDDPAVSHLREIADYKVDTKTNRAATDKSKVTISFTSEFAPTVHSPSGEKLEGQDIPYYDGRIDNATATVNYKVIDYGNTKIVRLSGINLQSLELAPREPKGSSQDSIEKTLKSLG